MPDDPLDPLLHVGGLTVRLDVVVTQPDTQVLHIRLTQVGDAVSGGEDVVVVDKGAAAELTVPVHQGSLEQELLR